MTMSDEDFDDDKVANMANTTFNTFDLTVTQLLSNNVNSSEVSKRHEEKASQTNVSISPEAEVVFNIVYHDRSAVCKKDEN